MVQKIIVALLACLMGSGLVTAEAPTSSAPDAANDAVADDTAPSAEKPKKHKKSSAEKAKEKLLLKANASFQQASAVVNAYGGGRTSWSELGRAEPTVHRTWDTFLTYQGENHPLVDDLALVRARSITAAGRTSEIVPAWNTALTKLPYTTSSGRRVNLYLEAAGAAADIEDYKTAEQYFAIARTLAVIGEPNADMTQLYMRLNELKATGVSMKWRPLRDTLLDLRRYAEHFALWSIPRLDALIGEMELRIKYQPESEEKRKDLSVLKAQIVLSEKGMGEFMPPMQLSQVRSLYYTLEDHWQL